MRYLAFIYIFFCFSTLAQSFSNSWQVKSDNGLTVVYKAKHSSDIYASVYIRKKARTNLNLLKNTKFMNDLQKKKKRMLFLVGASDWQLEGSLWKENYLKLYGSYRDSAGKLILFIEAHQYSKHGVKQVLYTQRKLGGKLVNKKLVQSLFRKHGMPF